ncbi:MAG: restriction endonuclease subunit S [Betaproteobacteria bacterium]
MSATKNRFYQLKNPAYVVSHLAVLIPKDRFFSDYLRHVLIKYPPSSLIKDLAYPAISLGDIQDFKVPVPEIFDDQIRIANLLSKVENLISRRREQLKQLDELLKSVFLEMFGLHNGDVKKWIIEPLSTCTEIVSGVTKELLIIKYNIIS